MISSKAGGDVYILCNDKKLCITFRGTGEEIKVLNIITSIIIYLYSFKPDSCF